MAPKRFFNDYEALNTDGITFCREIGQAVKPVIQKYIDDGFSLRDIQLVLADEALSIMAGHIIMNGINKKKAERLAQMNEGNNE